MTATATHISHKTKNGETMSTNVSTWATPSRRSSAIRKGSIMRMGDFQERMAYEYIERLDRARPRAGASRFSPRRW